MTTDSYGPNTAEVESLVASYSRIKPDQAARLAKAWQSVRNETWFLAFFVGAKAAEGDNRLDSWPKPCHELRSVALDPPLCSFRTLVATYNAARSALLALTVRDLISEDDFNTLYSPWKSMMEAEDDRDINSLSTTA